MLDPLSFTLAQVPHTPTPSYPQRKLLQPSPEHPDDYILELDYSTLAKGMECWRQLENYSLHSREAARDQSATLFGKLFHSCEELRLYNGWTDDMRAAQHKLITEHFLFHPSSPEDHRTASRMIQVLRAYEERYREDGLREKVYVHEDKPFIERAFKIEVATVEINTNVPYHIEQLVTGTEDRIDTVDFLPIRKLHILYTGRIDLVLSDSNMLWVMDHKTSSRDDGLEQFRLSLQTRGYTWAAQRLLGQPLAGCIINSVVIMPPLKSDRAVISPRTRFDRKPFFYSQDSLLEFEDNLRALVSDFVAMLVRGYFPQTARSFKSPCDMCDYRENCSLPFKDRERDLASSLYRNVTWNPVHQ